MPKCVECGISVGNPDEFYFCPTCGRSLCLEDKKTHTHAD